MANIFTLTLTIATLVTGILWCIGKFKCALAKRAKPTKNCTKGGIAETKVQKKPSWIETTSSVFPVLFVVFAVRSFIFEPFQIPSGSMMPTLLIGDFILVKKYSYGIKDPITQTTLVPTGHPKRGDIAVFKYPKNPSIDYIKRVIGLPGDRVTYNPLSKKVSIHPTCNYGSKPCDKTLLITYSEVQPSEFIQTFDGLGDNEIGNGFYQVPQGKTMPGGLRLAMRTEILDKVTYRILLVTQALTQSESYYQQPWQPHSSWVVPEGMYFMMGDNRDNSADSRFWGFVPERNFVGKATAIWMSFDKQERKWPTGVRLKRIGGIH